MNKNLKWLGLGGVLAAALLLAMNLQADDDLFEACMANVKKDCQSWAAKGGGGESPRGLTTDTKAELAINEKYILSGMVAIVAGEPFLRVDFNEHPWLASAVRMRNPFYRLDDVASNWKQYLGREITVVATAHYSTWADSQDRTVLEIYLVPGAQPVIAGLQPRPTSRQDDSQYCR